MQKDEEKEEISRELSKSGINSSNLDFYIEKAVGLFFKLNDTWLSSQYNEKQKLQNILFPDGIVYDRIKDRVRTLKTNSVMELIRFLSGISGCKKNGQKVNNTYLSALVIVTELFSNLFLEALREFKKFKW